MRFWKLASSAALTVGLLAAPAAAEPAAEPAKVEAEGLLSCGGPAAGAAPTAFVEYQQSGIVSSSYWAETRGDACNRAEQAALSAARSQCERYSIGRCYNCHDRNADDDRYAPQWSCSVRWQCTGN